MVHVRPKASHLAVCYKTLRATSPASSAIGLRIPISTFKHYSITCQPRLPSVPPKNRYTPFAKLQGIRHCSHQRNMCRNTADTSGGAMITKAREVLPTNVKPLHYDLTLEPDFEKFTFEGKVVIE